MGFLENFEGYFILRWFLLSVYPFLRGYLISLIRQRWYFVRSVRYGLPFSHLFPYMMHHFVNHITLFVECINTVKPYFKVKKKTLLCLLITLRVENPHFLLASRQVINAK